MAQTRHVLLILAAAMAGASCTSTPDHKIEREAELTAEVGEVYTSFLHADTYHKSHGFEPCTKDSPLEVANSGLISFTPSAVGKVDLCVALTYEGKRIDKYEFAVDVLPVAQEKVHARETSDARIADFAPKLEAMRKATLAVQDPAPSACAPTVAELSMEQRRLASFPEAPPRWDSGTARQFELLEELKALAPAQLAIAHTAESTEALQEVEAATGSSHAMVYRFTELKRPKVSGKTYSGGTARGWLFILAVDTAKVLCQGPFEYHPPSSVYVDSILPMKPGETIPEEYSEVMIVREMHQRGQTAVERQLAAMNPGWTLLRPEASRE